jgi:hypothetical protein
VLRLLAPDRLPSYNLSVLISILPGALARIQVEFSAFSQAFETKSYGGELESQYVSICISIRVFLNINTILTRSDRNQDPDKDPWNFQDGESKLGKVFLDMRYALRRDFTRECTF